MTSEQTLPVCSHCIDTHAMKLDERQVMCTHCPVPCQRCRHDGNGAYCATTPCGCNCHVKAPRRSAPTPWSPCAGATVPDVPGGMALEASFGDGPRFHTHMTAGRWSWLADKAKARYRIIPWPMTPAEKFERLAEALGDGFRTRQVNVVNVVIGDDNGDEVRVYSDGNELLSGPRDFNRRALDLLDQLQIGRDDVAEMVGGEGG